MGDVKLACELKRSNGQYYTRGNPFSYDPFKNWAEKIDLSQKTILEPFAGANHIIRSLKQINLCKDFMSFDIVPSDPDVKQRDTIKFFPKGYDVCVTNPPWLAKNSATRRGFSFHSKKYDDLYKHCINICLQNCDYVAALVPASFLQSNLFRERLSTFILLHDESIFNDTQNPVCLSLFDKDIVSDTSVYYDNKFIGNLKSLERSIPETKEKKKIEFNHPLGNLGFVSFDDTRKRTIRFCDVDEIKHYPVKVSSRFFTRIKCDVEKIPHFLEKINQKIEAFRNDTNDLFLTPFKGLRSDGSYRRRMSFYQARAFINDT